MSSRALRSAAARLAAPLIPAIALAVPACGGDREAGGDRPRTGGTAVIV
ncbi:MAG: hypothetical protein GWN02_30350, partial [Gemmatimonadetes bacterium]|nr:hypothetical protein [Gemmatimonadota bacterium]